MKKILLIAILLSLAMTAEAAKIAQCTEDADCSGDNACVQFTEPGSPISGACFPPETITVVEESTENIDELFEDDTGSVIATVGDVNFEPPTPPPPPPSPGEPPPSLPPPLQEQSALQKLADLLGRSARFAYRSTILSLNLTAGAAANPVLVVTSVATALAETTAVLGTASVVIFGLAVMAEDAAQRLSPNFSPMRSEKTIIRQQQGHPPPVITAVFDTVTGERIDAAPQGTPITIMGSFDVQSPHTVRFGDQEVPALTIFQTQILTTVPVLVQFGDDDVPQQVDRLVVVNGSSQARSEPFLFEVLPLEMPSPGVPPPDRPIIDAFVAENIRLFREIQAVDCSSTATAVFEEIQNPTDVTARFLTLCRNLVEQVAPDILARLANLQQKLNTVPTEELVILDAVAAPAASAIPLLEEQLTPGFADPDKDGIPALIETAINLRTVNELVTFAPIEATFKTVLSPEGCRPGFVGTFSFAARLVNISGTNLTGLQAQVTALTNGTLLQNADEGLGSIGSIRTIPQQDNFADGVLAPAEAVDVPFVLCITEPKKSFDFSVDILGVKQ